MKVKELLEKLSKVNQDIDVICSCEDLGIPPENHILMLFNIVSVDIVEAEKGRSEDRIPLLKFGKSPTSKKHIILEITSDF